MSKPVFKVSVRELVSFILRAGDLAGSGHFAGPSRALEGARGHQRLQKSRPPGYEAEVVVARRIETPELILELNGRIDGVLPQLGFVLIEEIKTTHGLWTGPADPLHLAQAKVYACLYCQDRALEACEIQLTYLDLASDKCIEFHEHHAAGALAAFYDPVVLEYIDWLRDLVRWRSLRDNSIRQFQFPFDAYREGQRALAVAVYRAVKNRSRLFAEAPTGIGKTVSVLFPSIKAMGEALTERIFYLTAKTVGRNIAEATLLKLRDGGLRLRSVTLTARDKICFNGGLPCDPVTCPFAIGYYDRIKKAVRAALVADSFDRAAIERIAREHQVCPFELSLDLSLWVDVIICDYNYAFDPSASLKRYFDGDAHNYALLIDEAHNLLDRAREMFSAELSRPALLALKRELQPDLPACAKALGRLATRLAALEKEEGWQSREGVSHRSDPPQKLAKPLDEFLEQAEAWLARNIPAPFQPALLDAFFQALAFKRVLESFGSHYCTLWNPATGLLRLCCIDPAPILHEALGAIGSAVFFSATLRPIEYFRSALGGEPLDPALALDSPFPPENLCVLVHDRIATRLRARAASSQAVAEAIAAFIAARSGNYLVYFPSYEYLAQVLELFRALAPSARIVVQSSAMTEAQRAEFIGQFQPAPAETTIGFAVLGGIFGEGIDLAGERLIGVAVVGVGLPQIGVEREIIRAQADARGRDGFDFAYTYPGMNRVLQAVGRVIRSETDRGAVLLIDERFGQRKHRELFPRWWRAVTVRSPGEIQRELSRFWLG